MQTETVERVTTTLLEEAQNAEYDELIIDENQPTTQAVSGANNHGSNGVASFLA